MVDFDRDVRPILHQLEANAQLISTRAGHIRDDMRRLPARPVWKTKASFELDTAETELWKALQAIRVAKEHYAKLETMKV
jgi:hypothetical protein